MAEAVSTSVSNQQRFTAAHPCPICGGHRGLPPGHGRRCYGFLSSDGEYAHCMREEHGGDLSPNVHDGSYAHRLKGDCRCGVQHGPGEAGTSVHLHIRREVVSETTYRVGEFEHVRREYNDGSKSFIWRTPDGRIGLGGVAVTDLPLYLADTLEAAEPGQLVLVTEGEKAADALSARGLLVVGTATGAKVCPADDVLGALRGYQVVLWPDNDTPGQQHMGMVAASLQRLGIECRVLHWEGAPPKADAFDFLEGGGTRAELGALIEAATTPEAATSGGLPPGLDVVRMSDIAPEPIDWLWRGRLAKGKLTLLMGDPGLGKSLITHWMAAQISQGRAWPDGESCSQGAAILFTIEDGLADTVVPRLIAAHADMDNVYAVRGVLDKDADTAARMFALTEHLAFLETLILKTGARYVAMDPISAYLGPKVNSHNEAEVRQALSPLAQVAERTGASFVLVCHLNKGTGVQALYRAGGSIAFGAVCRLVLGVAPDPNDEDGRRRVLLPIKQNIVEAGEGVGYRIEAASSGSILKNTTDQPPVLMWDSDPVLIDANSAMDRTGTAQELGSVSEVKSVLMTILGDGEEVLAARCKQEVKESVGTTSETVLARARKELGIKIRKHGFGTGSAWYWVLPSKITEDFPLPENGVFDSLNSLRESEDYQTLSKVIKDSSSLTRARVENTNTAPPLSRVEWEANAPCEDCHQRPREPGQVLCRECSDTAQGWLEAARASRGGITVPEVGR